MSPTCLLCFMVVLLGLVKLIPSVLHSHPVHETTSPDAALTAVSYQPVSAQLTRTRHPARGFSSNAQ